MFAITVHEIDSSVPELSDISSLLGSEYFSLNRMPSDCLLQFAATSTKMVGRSLAWQSGEFCEWFPEFLRCAAWFLLVVPRGILGSRGNKPAAEQPGRRYLVT